jgi:hypothetical protein
MSRKSIKGIDGVVTRIAIERTLSEIGKYTGQKTEGIDL